MRILRGALVAETWDISDIPPNQPQSAVSAGPRIPFGNGGFVSCKRNTVRHSPLERSKHRSIKDIEKVFLITVARKS